MQYLGNKDILTYHKTGFLCSMQCPAEVVLKSYEWAKTEREKKNCVICGNHSLIERDVFEILLKGSQLLILVLPRGLKKRWDRKWTKSIENGRLLIVSPFSNDIIRITREAAVKKIKLLLISVTVLRLYISPRVVS